MPRVPPRPSPPVRLDVGGASLVVALQRPAVLSGRALRTTAVPLHQGPAAAVSGGEVIVALPLRLQTQLVPVVLDVRLLLQSQVHLPWGRQDVQGETQGRGGEGREEWRERGSGRRKRTVSECSQPKGFGTYWVFRFECIALEKYR